MRTAVRIGAGRTVPAAAERRQKFLDGVAIHVTYRMYIR